MHRGGKLPPLLCLLLFLCLSTPHVRANQEEDNAAQQTLSQQSAASREEWQSDDGQDGKEPMEEIEKRALTAHDLLRFFFMAMHNQEGRNSFGSSSDIPFRPVRRMGSEFLGKRSIYDASDEESMEPHPDDIGIYFPEAYKESEGSMNNNGDEDDLWIPEKRRMGSEFLGKRRMGSEFLGKRRMGSEFLGKRRMGSEFLGKRAMGSEFLGKRRMGSEFLGKRRMGSEFLGKRRMGSEFLGKRRMGSEFLGKRSVDSESHSSEENSLDAEPKATDAVNLTDNKLYDRRKRSV